MGPKSCCLAAQLLGVSLLLESLAASSLSAQASSPAQAAPATASAAEANYSKEPFVVESLFSRAQFENDGTGRFENTARIRVQNDAGVQALRQLVFTYNGASERLEIAYVRLRRADGSVISADPAAFQDLAAQAVRKAPLYAEAREKLVSLPALQAGVTLEYSLAEIIEHPLAPGEFWFQYDFERTAITFDQQLELNVPAARLLHVKIRPGLEAKIEESAERRIYRWSESRLSHPEEAEKQQSALKQTAGVDISISTFSSWQEVGALYQSLQKERIAATPEIQKQAEEITRGKTAPAEKLGALYDYVATNFRSVNLPFGSARLQPNFAVDVLRNQYGDSKDKHTLLAALAAAQGLQADAVLISAQSNLDPESPSPAGVDHVITRVALAGKTVWLDTSAEVAPFGFLPASLRNKQALDVPAQGPSSLVETPADPPFPVRQQWRIEGVVSDLGKLDAHVRYILSGDNELLMRQAFRRTPETNWKKLGEAIASADGLRGTVDEVSPSDPADTHHPFTLRYHLVQPNFLDWPAKRAVLSPPLPPLALPQTDASSAMPADPLGLGSPAEVDLEMQLAIPARYTARAPVATSAAREYGEFRSTYSAEKHVLSTSRTLVVRQREIPPEKVGDYTLFFRRAVRNDESQTFSLESALAGAAAIPADASADDLVQAATGAYSSQRFSLAEQLLEHAVVRDPRHKTAWKLLGAVRLAQQQNSKAIEAFRKQTELEPGDPSAYEGMGLAQAALEKYPEAIASFRKQLEVKPLDPVAQASLATTLVQAQRYAEAVPELKKAIALAPEDPRFPVSLGKCYLELHENEKAEEAFDKAVEISPTPLIWNNVAYELSRYSVNLPRAQKYAESAVAATSAELRDAELERLTARDLGNVAALASYWDTLGWVFFLSGDLKRAERFEEAAWRLDFHGEAGGHLAQIYEKQGRREEALRTYALALAASRAAPETRARLELLAGGVPQGGAQIEAARAALPRLRQFSVENPLPPGAQGAAEFFVLFAVGVRGTAVKFIRGDSALRAAAEKIRALDFGRVFPDESPAKLVRRGTLTCAAGAKSCVFTLLPAESAQALE